MQEQVEAALAGANVEGDSNNDRFIREDKAIRKALDTIIQFMRSSQRSSRERSLCLTKMQEAIMWSGMDLKDLNEGRSIYPESYNPASTVVEPTADGLKM